MACSCIKILIIIIIIIIIIVVVVVDAATFAFVCRIFLFPFPFECMSLRVFCHYYSTHSCRKILRGSNLSFFFCHFPFQAQQYCQLRHVISLWRLLALERAKILIRRGEVRNMNISTCNLHLPLHDISKDFVTTFS